MKALDHKLDTLGTAVLNTIKSIDIFQDAVIAGGYLRDMIAGKPFKDIDIFLPKIMPGMVKQTLLNSLPSDYKCIKTFGENFGSHPEYSMNFTIHDLSYLDNIQVQVIGTNFPKKDFIPQLINSFDFGLCQVFSDGKEVYGTDQFNQDLRYEQATLLNINSVSELPKEMKRFFRFQEKYPKLTFRCPSLEIKKPEKDDLEMIQEKLVYQHANTLAHHDFLNLTLDDVVLHGVGVTHMNWPLIEEMQNHPAPSVYQHADLLIEQAIDHYGSSILDDSNDYHDDAMILD